MSQFRILDYNYVFDDIDIEATSEASAFPASNLQNFSRSKVYRSAGVNSQRIVFDLQTPVSIDSILVLFDRESNILISDTAVFKVEANPTNYWSSPDFSENITLNNDHHIAYKFLSTAEEHRFWSIYVHDLANTLGYFEIGKVILAKATQLSQMPSIGFDVANIDPSGLQVNPYGVQFADCYPYVRKASFSYRLLSETDKQTMDEIYTRVGKVKPVALCLDPTQAYFNSAAEHAFYGYFDSDFRMKNQAVTYFDADIQLREAL